MNRELKLILKNSYKKIIRIDDDNIPTNDDFIGFHNIVGTNLNGTVISSNNGWYNICDELIDEDGIDFYPRGYLYEKRWEETTTNKFNKKVKQKETKKEEEEIDPRWNKLKNLLNDNK